jgi:hypothetical protein
VIGGVGLSASEGWPMQLLAPGAKKRGLCNWSEALGSGDWLWAGAISDSDSDLIAFAFGSRRLSFGSGSWLGSSDGCMGSCAGSRPNIRLRVTGSGALRPCPL